jgi:hypothetical protein
MSKQARRELNSHIDEHSDERAKANAAAAVEEAERKTRQSKRREQNRAEWINNYRRLYLVHARRAEEFARRIKELRGEEEGHGS